MTIEGIPDGWELVRIGPVTYGEWRLMDNGKVMQWTTALPSTGWAVVLRKIEKPKQYRPFANAAEFEPHRDRWISRAYNDRPNAKGFFKAFAYDDRSLWDSESTRTYQETFDEGRRFDDGTPFGVEVQS